jgi:hypothetical protein
MKGIVRHFESAFSRAVDLGSHLEQKDPDADLRDIADGLLAGALQFWLYSRQPCGDPRCEQCEDLSTAESRMRDLRRFAVQLVFESENAPAEARPSSDADNLCA